MKHNVKKYLIDVLHSIELVKSYMQKAESLDQYRENQELQDAIERRLAIIGEALFQLDKFEKNVAISYKKNIISLRHILVHNYDIVEDEVIWDIGTIHLDQLKTEAENFLNDPNF